MGANFFDRHARFLACGAPFDHERYVVGIHRPFVDTKVNVIEKGLTSDEQWNLPNHINTRSRAPLIQDPFIKTRFMQMDDKKFPLFLSAVRKEYYFNIFIF